LKKYLDIELYELLVAYEENKMRGDKKIVLREGDKGE
jgi:hypothetical protein